MEFKEERKRMYVSVCLSIHPLSSMDSFAALSFRCPHTFPCSSHPPPSPRAQALYEPCKTVSEVHPSTSAIGIVFSEVIHGFSKQGKHFQAFLD